MSISFSRALGVHEQALVVRSRRAELLASNLAHADTPHYKARDIDFKAALEAARAGQGGGLARTHEGHIAAGAPGAGGEPLYRIPEQPSLDGNTVNRRVEHVKFTENALHYQASITFLSGRFGGLRTAIRGE
jgi:flagellar basal-body rod protein FlgB